MSDVREGPEEPELFEGEEELLRQPTLQDPYTPEPGPRPGDQRAFRLMRLALLVLVVVAVIVLIAALR